MFPQISPIMNSLSPTTQNDILGILQREQDRAVGLLSSSPLLASLFVSYANQAAAFESVSATSPTESDEWKALENTISTLQEEVDKLKPENIKMAEKLEAGAASQEAFRSQVASLKEANATYQHDIHSLRAELTESKDKHDRLLRDSSAERDSLLKMVSDLEIQRAELKETVVEQQLKVAKLERLVEREEKEKAKQEAKRSAHQETGMGGKERDQKSSAPTILSTWGPAVEEDDPPKKVSRLSRKEQKNEWGGGWGVGPTEEKSKTYALPPIDPLSVPVDLPGGGEPTSFAKKDPSDSAVKVELRAPEEDKDIHIPSDFSVVSSPVVPSRVVICSENERFTDAERPTPHQSPRPTLVQHPVPEASSNFTSELLRVPQAVKEQASTAPKSSPTPCLTQSPAPAHTSTKNEPEKPLSLWERKKLKAIPVPDVSGSCDAISLSGVCGDVAGGTERIAMPTLKGPGDRQSIFTDTARDQKRENQRENLVEGFLGPSPRRRNDSAQSQITEKPAPSPVPTSNSSGWGKSDLNGPARVQPQPKNPPAGSGSSNKLGWDGAWGNAWGDVKNVSTPRTQKVSNGSARGAHPSVSGWFKNFPGDVQANPPRGSPNTAGPENIPENAVEIKHVPAPGLFRDSITDKEEAKGI